MEYNGHGFLEELLALRNNHWEASIPTGMNDFYSNVDSVENPFAIPPNSYSSFGEFSLPFDQSLNSSFTEFSYPFGNEVSPPELTDSSNNILDTPPFPTQEEYPLSIIRDDEEPGHQFGTAQHKLEAQAPFKMEPIQSNEVLISLEKQNNKIKKLDGQPSKNLMAERRRRKRLNDRLSMLRSVVPKISKMDRTSILGDTIEYMKELLERINTLEGDIEVGSNHLNLMGIFKNVRPNEILVRNSPKFDVERRNTDTRIEICCAGKPGLLLSTVTTLEALGLEIQQCVISCFNDFAVQASCSEELEQRALTSSEDIKQALFRNAGYGGRCL